MLFKKNPGCQGFGENSLGWRDWYGNYISTYWTLKYGVRGQSSINTGHRIRAVTLPPMTNPQLAPLVLFLIGSFPFG